MPSSSGPIPINKTLALPLEELRFEFSHASGPGGQHVNKVATCCTLCFDLEASRTLTQTQKQRLRSALQSRLTQDSILRIRAADQRSQSRNREAAIQRFAALLRQCLRPRRSRRPTRPTRASRERRLQGKKRRAERLRSRRPPSTE